MGIKPLKPGFKEYRIEPYFPNKMDNLDVAFESPNGTIGLSWRRVSDVITLTVTVPHNSLGKVVLDEEENLLKPGENVFVQKNGNWKRGK